MTSGKLKAMEMTNPIFITSLDSDCERLTRMLPGRERERGRKL